MTSIKELLKHEHQRGWGILSLLIERNLIRVMRTRDIWWNNQKYSARS